MCKKYDEYKKSRRETNFVQNKQKLETKRLQFLKVHK